MTTQDVVINTEENKIESSTCSDVVVPACFDERKWSVSTIDGDIQEIHQYIPEGIEVRKAFYGFGLYATKSFKKGSVIYLGQQIIIPNMYKEFRLVLDNQPGVEFILDTDTHSAQFSDTKRWLYLFDSFMNHSCDPTTIFQQSTEQRAQNIYQTIALKDIVPDDEITCDYNLYEYDCHGKVIEQCMCSSSKCIGRIAGFRYLSVKEQKVLLALVEPEVLQAMSVEPTNKFFFIPDLRCPTDRVSIELCFPTAVDLYKIVATRGFAKGEIVYSNESLLFPEDCVIVIEVNGKRKWLENLVHTVNKGEGKREFYFFDSFQNHSCDPNTKMIYHTENHYDMVALRDIEQGDELTSDYETFDVGLDGTWFHCHCGTKACRGIVTAGSL